MLWERSTRLSSPAS